MAAPKPTKAMPLYDLIEAVRARVDDTIQVSARAKPWKVIERTPMPDGAIRLKLASTEVRTYYPGEKIILRARPQEQNL